MVKYLKENGYPVSLILKTEEFIDPKLEFKGYKTKVFDGYKNLIKEFIHSNLRDRNHWVDGFYAGMKFENPGYKEDWERETKNPEEPIMGENGSRLEVGDWIVTYDDKVKKIIRDSQPDLPFSDIKRFASKGEIKNVEEINRLQDLLITTRGDNKGAWESYGSELCTADLLNKETQIETKIQKLRDEIL